MLKINANQERDLYNQTTRFRLYDSVCGKPVGTDIVECKVIDMMKISLYDI